MSSDNDVLHQPQYAQQKPSNSSKTLKPLVMLTTVLLVAVATGISGYILGRGVNKQPPSPQDTRFAITSPAITRPSLIPSPTSSSEPISTTNWKTYHDKKQKYAIKYPESWYVFPYAVGGFAPGYEKTVINSAGHLEPHGEILAEEGEAGVSIGIVGLDKSPNESLPLYAKRKFSSVDPKGRDYKNTLIGSVPAIVYTLSDETENEILIYFVDNGNLVYWMSVQVRNLSYKGLVDRMISTFEFTE
jgi:hypothetical protein